MNSKPASNRLPLDVPSALHAICTTGKGCCWFCDAKLPAEAEAVEKGWDVQRIDDHPVASIILVCPNCLRAAAGDEGAALAGVPITALASPRHSRGRRTTP